MVDCFTTSYNFFSIAKFVEGFCKKCQNIQSGNSHTLVDIIKTLTFDYLCFKSITGLPDQSINFADFDVVQFLDSRFNLVLVGLQVADKNQSIVIFNLLHGRLCGQRMLDDIVSI